MKIDPHKALVAICLALSVAVASGWVHAESIIVQSTTSTANSGLYDYLLPQVQKDTGVTVHVVAVGTGQAIKNAMNCDGDVLLVHARASEQKFVDAGYGLSRADVMYNDFVFVGPPSDPAGINVAPPAMGQAKFRSTNFHCPCFRKLVDFGAF